MDNEENKNIENATTDMQDMVAQLADIRANTVSKDEYEKVVKDRKDLWKALVEGQSVDSNSSNSQLRKSMDIANDIRGGGYDARRFVELACEYREAILAESKGKYDPFRFHGYDAQLSDADEANIDAVENVLEEMKEFKDADDDRWYSEWTMRLPKNKNKKF